MGSATVSETQQENSPAESSEDRRARKVAAAERIAARRKALPDDFSERQELLGYLDERYGV